jgi:hypothetical protein
MRILRLIIACGLIALPTAPPAATGPVLAKLEYGPGIFFPDRTSIYTVSRVQQSPYAGKPRKEWVLRSGDSLSSASQPPDRLIRFYRLHDKKPQLVYTVSVKYFSVNGVWRPGYQLWMQPRVAFDGSRIVSVTGAQQMPGIIQRFDRQRPDRDGYFRELVITHTNDVIIIDAWEVQ